MAIPLADIPQHGAGQQGQQGEGSEAALAPAHDDDGGGERAKRRTGIAADLKQGLRHAVATAGRRADDTRGFGMEDRGAHAERAGAQQQKRIGVRYRQDDQAGQGEQWSARQGQRRRAAIGI